MQRQSESTLHRQRDINCADWMIDQGTAEEVVKRVMDQPRGMRWQYTIMQAGTVYQPDQIQVLAQEFGLADSPDAPIPDNDTDAFATKL
jgi:hypothetical protein